MLGAVRAESEMQALRAHGGGEFGQRVALRPHLYDGPIGEVRVVHRESIVMLGHRNDVLRAGSLEELRPFGGVEVLGAEKRNQILVAFCIVAIRVVLFEVLVCAVLGVVHVARDTTRSRRRERNRRPSG